MQLHHKDGVFWLDCEFEERFAAKGAKFMWHDPSKRDCWGKCVPCSMGLYKKWWTKHTQNAAKLVQYADDNAKKAIEKFQNNLEASRANNVIDEEAFSKLVPSPEDIDYFPFQKAGILFATDKLYTLNADDPGLGKTIQSAGFINSMPDARRIIVVCPASLRLNWERELKKWLVLPWYIKVINKNEDVLDMPDDTYHNTEKLILIINYDKFGTKDNNKIKTYAKLLDTEWDLLVCDEAHYMKNEKTQRSQVILGKYNKKGQLVYPGLTYVSKKLLFLTGTPIPNKPFEAWPLVRALDPTDLGSNFGRFAFRYCAPKQVHIGRGRMRWDFTGSSNREELQIQLRKFMVRRLKSEVLRELPPKTRQIIEIPANGAEGKIKKQNEKSEETEKQLQELEEAVKTAEVLEDEQAFQEATKQLEEAQNVLFEEMSKERKEVALKKLPFVIEHIQNFLGGSSSKLVIFAHHHEIVDEVKETLKKAEIKCVTLTGKTPMKKRQESVDAFQNDPDVRVFIGNIQAAGVGITLTAADTCIFIEFSWVPSDCTQAESRLQRIGQVNPILIQYIVFEGSIESRMLQTMTRKMEVIDEVLDKEINMDEVTVTPVPVKEKKEKKIAGLVISDEAKAAAAKLMQRLASTCDGARREDGMGFNKFDTRFGKELARRSTQRVFTNKEFVVAKKMITKYKGQFGNNNELLATLVVLDDVTDGTLIGDPFNLL